MPEYKYKVGDRVFYLRNRDWSEQEVGTTDLGTIIELDDIETTPNCYTTMFQLKTEGDASDDTPTITQDIVRKLHFDQIALVSDSSQYRVMQVVKYDGVLNEHFSEEVIENWGNLALIGDIKTDDNGEKEIKLLRPPIVARENKFDYAYVGEKEIEKYIYPLRPIAIQDVYQENTRNNQNYADLFLFLKRIGISVNFRAVDWAKCINCAEWLNSQINEYVRDVGYICSPCSETYTYDCDCCKKHIQFQDNHPRWITVEGQDKTVCRSCSDTRVFGCRDCGEHYIDKEHYYINSNKLCEKCFNRSCTSIITSPPRALPRPNIARILVPDDKLYRVNKSKTPVALEIECISEYEFEVDEDNTAYIENIPFGWHDTYDGSLSEHGREFVMQPEVGDEALKRVKELCSWAINNDWYTDNSCGIHVHTDAFYSGVSELKGILITMRVLEPFIYMMLPERRSSSRYSAPMSDNVTTEEILDMKTVGDFCDLWYRKMNGTITTADKYNESRYRGLNLHSRILHGTIEYRYHHGTLNSDRIRDWVLFCLAISDFGSKLMTLSSKYSKLFINQESNDFSDYLSAMKAESLIPYVESMMRENGSLPSGTEPAWRSASELDNLRDTSSDSREEY